MVQKCSRKLGGGAVRILGTKMATRRNFILPTHNYYYYYYYYYYYLLAYLFTYLFTYLLIYFLFTYLVT